MDIELLKEIFKFQTLNGLGNKPEPNNWTNIMQTLVIMGCFITIWISFQTKFNTLKNIQTIPKIN